MIKEWLQDWLEIKPAASFLSLHYLGYEDDRIISVVAKDIAMHGTLYKSIKQITGA